eukprot:473698_1
MSDEGATETNGESLMHPMASTPKISALVEYSAKNVKISTSKLQGNSSPPIKSSVSPIKSSVSPIKSISKLGDELPFATIELSTGMAGMHPEHPINQIKQQMAMTIKAKKKINEKTTCEVNSTINDNNISSIKDCNAHQIIYILQNNLFETLKRPKLN